MHKRDEKCKKKFVRKHEGKRPLEEPLDRWDNNSKMDLKTNRV